MTNKIKEILLQNSILPKNLYLDRYLKLLYLCSLKKFEGYTEAHHIIPKAFGGNNSQENMIVLSARCHFLAHYLLAKGTNNPKMIKALHRMVYSKNNYIRREYKVTSKVYEYLRIQHAKVVSEYSKNTVTVRNIITNEIKRIPKEIFLEEKDVLYVGINKNRKCTKEEIEKRKKATTGCPRKVYIDIKKRSLAASKYTYITPKGYCRNSTELLKLYPSFTRNTLIVLKDDFIISKKFASIHKEFLPFVKKTLIEIGFKRIERDEK
jgi:hypothetical protein